MFMKKVKAEVISSKMIEKDIYDLCLNYEGAKDAKPGQFVGVFPESDAHLLMRPISICSFDDKTLRLVYRVVGFGTDEFSKFKEGDSAIILGNLGNGFDVDLCKGKTVVLMGGGIGIPPMLGLAKTLKEKGITDDVHAFLGYRDKNTFLDKEFEEVCNVHLASDNGEIGFHGNVVDALKSSGIKADVIMACGPMPMLKGIKYYAEGENIDAYISLEERMACGVGACLGCVVKTTKEDHHSHVNNARICTDGPVFDARDVDI